VSLSFLLAEAILGVAVVGAYVFNMPLLFLIAAAGFALVNALEMEGVIRHGAVGSVPSNAASAELPVGAATANEER
jgi:hypothetical protein